GLDNDRTVQVPVALVERLSRLAFPGLRLVERRGVDETDVGGRAQARHGVAEQREPVAEVGAEAQIDAGHERRRVNSPPGVPTRPSSGGVSFLTRTRTSDTGNSRSSASAMSPARRSSKFTRLWVPISTMRWTTRP